MLFSNRGRQLAIWAPDAAVRKKILVDNPARLYGFT
jgi:predicted TIM-barrel fold metal-dependent hydrolase